MQQVLLPTKSVERIVALDTLRGFAILGILIMNIQSFSMPMSAYINPTAYGDLDGINRWVWIISHLFGDQKFMTIFSILFGAGIILFTKKAETRNARSAGLHYRRTFWLLVIGLIHAHFIWYGDILVPYAICALFVYLFRKIRPAPLLIIGIFFFAIHTLIYGFFGFTIENWPEESINSIKSSWTPDDIELDAEINVITGSITEQIKRNSQSAIFLETMEFLMLFLWRVGGLMLIGMALYKWGVLSALKSAKFYIRGLIISWLIGFPIVIFGIFQNFKAEWSIEYSMFLGSQFNYWGSIFVSFGYICIIMLISQSKAIPWITERLAAIGQMALTNYIAQSIICITLFFGIGFGLFGKVERIGQVGIVLVIWIIQLAWSKPWLNRYRFGPLEWLWRSLSYGKRQPMHRKFKN